MPTSTYSFVVNLPIPSFDYFAEIISILELTFSPNKSLECFFFFLIHFFFLFALKHCVIIIIIIIIIIQHSSVLGTSASDCP